MNRLIALRVLTLAVFAPLAAAPVFAQGTPGMYHPQSIQPETTIDISAQAAAQRTPDIATISVGVQANGKTASEAMATQSKLMNGLFDALKKAKIDAKDMQTSSLSLYPEYDYLQINEENGVVRQEQRLRGYVASNQLTVKVRDLNNLGATLDNLVNAGGNTINGISFALDNPKEAEDEARRKAMREAIARAELFATEAGYSVGRIVTISENVQNYYQPMPMAYARADLAMDAAPTPVAAGEVGYSAQVNVRFELVK